MAISYMHGYEGDSVYCFTHLSVSKREFILSLIWDVNCTIKRLINYLRERERK